MSIKVFKSVHITNYYHENSGGVKTNYNWLLEAANIYRRFVRLIVPGEKDKIEEVGDFGRIYYIAAKPFPLFDNRYRIMLPWNTYLDHGLPIRKILRAERPQMIEIYDNYSLSLLAGIIRKGFFKSVERPMLVYFTGERMDNLFSSYILSGIFSKWFSRRVIGNYNFPMFDFHIANSEYVAAEILESVSKKHNPYRSDKFFNFCWQYFKAARVPFEETIAICPRGVNTEHFSPRRRSAEFKNAIKSEAGISENELILLYAGRISPDKNISLLLDLMETLKRNETHDIRLLVAGAGPKAEWLKEETEKRYPQLIIQLGHLEREKLANLYANCDVFIHPNPKEPFGNVVLEAMASGVPVVAPNSGGLLSFSSNENAWLVEPNGETFAAAIQEIFTDNELREKKIQNALATANSNSQQTSIERLLATYDKMYEDFLKRNELFTDIGQSEVFDFATLAQ